MARTESNMMDLGTPAPDFKLYDTVSGKELSYSDVAGKKGTLVVFICNHCPFVIHILDGLIALSREVMSKGVGVVAISSNDVSNYPDDSPEKMRELAKHKSFPFPYLYDESQEIAKSYEAACTPDFFLFDNKQACVYRGQMDDSRPGNNKPVTGNDLRKAVDDMIKGRKISKDQKPGIGCNIKWKQ